MAKLSFWDYKNHGGCEREIRKLYRAAFPKEERMPFWALKHLAKKNNAKLYGIYEGHQFVGMMYHVYYKDIIYVFFFAVREDLRGKSYGTRILQAVRRRFADRRLILMIEELDPAAENYGQRAKRKAFYEKNGFTGLGYRVKEGSVVYEMLCSSREGRGVSKEEYMELMKAYFGDFLFTHVYQRLSK